MENFIMLPNKIVWNNKNNKDTYFKKYGDKILHILSYLDCYTNRVCKTVFCLKDLIISASLKCRTGKNNTNEQFKTILINLQKEKILTNVNVDLKNIKIDTCINCIFHMPLEKENNKFIKFFPILQKDYLRIMDYYIGNLNKLTLLKIYYYINARLSRREVEFKDKQKNDLIINGGKAECFYDSYYNICKDLEITENTFCTYIKELQKMDLLCYDNIGLVEKDNKTFVANNVYVINKLELEEALKQSTLYYEDNGYTIYGKKTTKDMKKINGLKGKIQQQENLTKDTTKLERQLKELKLKRQKIKNKNNETEHENKNEEKHYWGKPRPEKFKLIDIQDEEIEDLL